LALLLGNSGEGAIEIAQRQPPCWVGCRYWKWPLIVEGDGEAFAHAAADAVYILVMHNGEEPGAKFGAALPETLLRYCTDEGVLDEVVCSGHVSGHCNSIAPQPRDFFFEKSTEFVHLTL
jgi:hypothetical protein